MGKQPERAAGERERLARKAYGAFDAAMGPHTDLYPWDDMPATMQAGWRAVAAAVLADRAAGEAGEPVGCPAPGACSCVAARVYGAAY